jgi:glucose-6-phosphate 1-dehydrogenase
LVIFGASGDLAHRRILPAIYDLANGGRLPAGFAVIGVGRADWDTERFRHHAHSAISSGARTPFRQRVWEQLASTLEYIPGDVQNSTTFEALGEALTRVDSELGTGGGRVFYLSVPPDRFAAVALGLAAAKLVTAEAKVVVERPFGNDLASAQALEKALAKSFKPTQIFRIDHYLGKQTVLGMLVSRFANQVFEPLWRHEYVDHVQITMAEDVGVGSRGGYYDQLGVTRDLIQNHLLQLAAITAMEPPKSFAAADLQAAKSAALANLRLDGPVELATARGQYAPGWQGNLPARGYLEEDGVAADSTTETYAAIKLAVDTPRWQGTPFYLQAGKRLGRRATEVAIVFKTSEWLAASGLGVGAMQANSLVTRIQPDQGMSLKVGTKVPQTALAVRDVTMDFAYGHAFTDALPDAYERLILDVLDAADTLFPSAAEIEASWRLIDPIEDYWRSSGEGPEPYPAGTWGPAGGQALLARDGREWRRP